MVLQLVEMGCNIDEKYSEKLFKFTDLGNHRYRLHFIDKDGKRIYGDVSSWDVPEYPKPNSLTYSSKRGYFAVHSDLSCHGYGLYGINHDIKQPGEFSYGWGYNTSEYPYTKEGILKLINHYAKDVYDEIEILSMGDKILEEWSEWFESEVF